MKKTTKGAVAAGTAAFLMLGGAGTFAVWTDDATADVGTIESGSMSIEPALDPVSGLACTDWVHTNGRSAGFPVVRTVPGDRITKTCSFTVRAEGDNLEATLTTPSELTYTASGTAGNDAPAAGRLSLPITATYALGGSNVATVTQADDGEVLTATITADFPLGTATVNGNDTQDVLADLDELTVTLDQVRQTP